jgi:peptide methionine sulfoxide reductase MsrA
MSKKQTAVQYLEELLKVILYYLDDDELQRIQEVIDEAKKIEKNQIMESNIVGVNQGLYGYRSAEQYYKKNFKK